MNFDELQKIYDREYFEEGTVTGKSCYRNYRWLPESTIRMAYNIIKYLKFADHEKILDYGCSMGYLVKAFRILDIQAFGSDISEYALKMADLDVREFCGRVTDKSINPFGFQFDWIISKDVLEHLDEECIDFFLADSINYTDKMFHVIPLAAKAGTFVVPNYHEDISHIQIQTREWWDAKFENHGWEVVNFDFKVKGIKENWTSLYDEGNGFYTLQRNS